MKNKQFLLTAPLFLLLTLFISISGYSQTAEGTIESFDLESPSLANNWIEDFHHRSVKIYLPPGYDTITKRYPVLYLLHGFTLHNSVWLGLGSTVKVNIEEIMNYLIKEELIEPFIVVMPDSYNRYHGSWYTNSIVTGNWEDFIVYDLVQYIDSTYRSLPYPESRGIAGHSMGGYGAMKFAMKHPDIFSAVYPHCGAIDLEKLFMGTMRDVMTETVKGDRSSWENYACVAAAAAFAPDSTLDPPGQFPVSKTGSKISNTWRKWLEHDPYSMIPAFKDSLLKLKAIQFDVGESDPFMYEGNIRFSEALTNNGIEHIFETYPGDHSSNIHSRTRDMIMPFFSENLVPDTNWTSIKSREKFSWDCILNQNHPNPFSSRTWIEFHLQQPKTVRIDVCNTLGKRIVTILEGPRQAGRNILEFNASDLPDGIYFYRISTDKFQDTKRMILMR